MLIKITVDDFILDPNYQGLWTMTLIMLALLIVESLLRYSFIYSTNWLGQTIIKNLRVRVFRHITSLRMKYFDNTPIGTAITRSISDVETINDMFAQGIISMIADVLTILVIVGVMLSVSVPLTLVSLSTLPIMIWATYIFQKNVKAAFEIVRKKVAELNAFAQEHITGMKVVQIFTAEEREKKKFEKINNEHKKAYIKSIWYYSIFFPVIEIVSASAIALMIWYGARGILVGTVEGPGTLLAFILFINMIFRPMRMLADRFNTIQMGLVAANRVFNLLDTKTFIDNEGNGNADHLEGKVDFKNVWFAYNDEDWVLRNVSFNVEPGETLAIVGATGAGKSSVINILSRFYPFNKGELLVDGMDVRDYKLESLRSNIGLVLQDVFLFSGSIMDNITLSDSRISKEDVIEASKLVGAHEFIMKLPGDYDYNVMERGATLSMGQRQLISFIRTLVYDPRILVLDEATSSIDTESEIMIQNAIEKMIVDRTSVVIAHRLSTIQHANKILVLDKGEVMEIGSHDTLMAKGGYYKKLYEMQFSSRETA